MSTIRRVKHGKGFSYTIGDRPVQDKTVLERIKTYRVPPAWREVTINSRPKAKILARGIDEAGRMQYVYNPAYQLKQEQRKYDRILQFGQALPKLRRQVAKDLGRRRFDKRKVTACAISLLDRAYFRVGNETYAKQHKSYGLTTLRSKHVQVEGDQITFDFIGKSGQHQVKRLTDRRLATMLQKLDDMPGYELFRYYQPDGTLRNVTSQDVNDYLKQYMGDEFSAKDFRTWGGTLAAGMTLAQMERPNSERERKKTITKCIKRVARKLGNTPAIARKSYVDPRIIAAYHQSDALKAIYETVQSVKRRSYVQPEEQCLLKALRG